MWSRLGAGIHCVAARPVPNFESPARTDRGDAVPVSARDVPGEGVCVEGEEMRAVRASGGGPARVERLKLCHESKRDVPSARLPECLV